MESIIINIGIQHTIYLKFILTCLKNETFSRENICILETSFFLFMASLVYHKNSSATRTSSLWALRRLRMQKFYFFLGSWPISNLWWYSPLLISLFNTIRTTTITRLLVFSISLGALVACADFLLCVFLWDGRVALCKCLKDTKTFGLGFAKRRVWSLEAPRGA